MAENTDKFQECVNKVLDHILVEYRSLYAGALAIVLLAVGGFFFYKFEQKKKAQTFAREWMQLQEKTEAYRNSLKPTDSKDKKEPIKKEPDESHALNDELIKDYEDFVSSHLDVAGVVEPALELMTFYEGQLQFDKSNQIIEKLKNSKTPIIFKEVQQLRYCVNLENMNKDPKECYDTVFSNNRGLKTIRLDAGYNLVRFFHKSGNKELATSTLTKLKALDEKSPYVEDAKDALNTPTQL